MLQNPHSLDPLDSSIIFAPPKKIDASQLASKNSAGATLEPLQEPQDQRERLEQKKGRRFLLHPGKLTCPLKRDYFNRKYIFQPSTFRGHVSLRECKVHGGCCGSPITPSKWGSVKLKKEGFCT